MFGRGIQLDPRRCICGEMQGTSGGRVDVRKEGATSSAQGSRAPVAIAILVKKPKYGLHDGCRIHYRDIGDYLTREQKLETLKDAGAISGIREWQTITPDSTLRLDRTTELCICSFLPARVAGGEGG